MRAMPASLRSAMPVIDTDFQIVLKYIGSSGNNALFDMRVMTSRQVPGDTDPAHHPAQHGCPANLNQSLFSAEVFR